MALSRCAFGAWKLTAAFVDKKVRGRYELRLDPMAPEDSSWSTRITTRWTENSGVPACRLTTVSRPYGGCARPQLDVGLA